MKSTAVIATSLALVSAVSGAAINLKKRDATLTAPTKNQKQNVCDPLRITFTGADSDLEKAQIKLVRNYVDTLDLGEHDFDNGALDKEFDIPDVTSGFHLGSGDDKDLDGTWELQLTLVESGTFSRDSEDIKLDIELNDNRDDNSCKGVPSGTSSGSSNGTTSSSSSDDDDDAAFALGAPFKLAAGAAAVAGAMMFF